MSKQSLEALADQIREEVIGRVKAAENLTIVKAPPGSGKTHLLVDVLRCAVSEEKLRVAVATQTNSQAHEVCERLMRQHPDVPIVRFVSSSFDEEVDYDVTSSKDDLPHVPCVVVATSAKWGSTQLDSSFDYLFVEESWQLKFSDFVPLCQVSGRFVLVGDPGQISPVVSVDPSRWATAPVPPHLAAPEVLLLKNILNGSPLELPATRRLPKDSAEYVKSFYDFDFGALTDRVNRTIKFNRALKGPLKNISEEMANSSLVAALINTPKEGPPLHSDKEMAGTISNIVTELVANKAKLSIDGVERELQPGDIGISSTHRIMVQELSLSIPSELRRFVVADTPERWQGLERPIMIVTHPLSSVTRPSQFDLETGRLCVMASRHKVNLIMVSRDHIEDTLGDYDPPGDQPLGWPDETGRGHVAHLDFISKLKKNGFYCNVG